MTIRNEKTKQRSMHITLALGTRPEVIKLAPVVQELKRQNIAYRLIHTGQHDTLSEDFLNFFQLSEITRLHCMQAGASVAELSSNILQELNRHPHLTSTDAMIVQGDTTSAFAAAYWAFANQIPVLHVEAGLRTNDLSSPFPEEANRQLISKIAKLHFVPTRTAGQNLISENISPQKIHWVGNTGIDALKWTINRLTESTLPKSVVEFTSQSKFAVVTIHRRENQGQFLKDVANALSQLVNSQSDLRLVVVLHPNPQIRLPLLALLGRHAQIRLIEPLGYTAFIQLLQNSEFILTDSGGIQEEAPSLGKPILVLRNNTERPEGILAGCAQLVGADINKICKVAKEILSGESPLLKCKEKLKDSELFQSPYGDGNAAKRIVNYLKSTTINAFDSSDNLTNFNFTLNTHKELSVVVGQPE